MSNPPNHGKHKERSKIMYFEAYKENIEKKKSADRQLGSIVIVKL